MSIVPQNEEVSISNIRKVLMIFSVFSLKILKSFTTFSMELESGNVMLDV